MKKYKHLLALGIALAGIDMITFGNDYGWLGLLPMWFMTL